MSRTLQAALCAAIACTGTAVAAPALPMLHHVSPLALHEAGTDDALSSGHAATLNQPLGIALDHAGNLYVANLNSGVTIYNPKLQLTGQISVSLPTAVGVNAANNRIMVTSGATYGVSIFDQNHNQVGSITDGSLRYPLSMFVDGNDDTWVLDNAGVAHVYLNDGTPAGSTALGGGSAIGPAGSNFSVWGVPYMSGVNAVWFGNIGQALHNGPSLDEGGIAGVPLAGGVAEDAQLNTYITDQNNSAVQVIANGTTNTTEFSTPAGPYGIAIDPVRGRIYVSFPQANIIDVYALKTHKLLSTLH